MLPIPRGAACFPALVLALLSFSACADDVGAAPSYEGPLPSPTAQSALQGLVGRTLDLGGLAPEGTRLSVRAFGVVPNAVTGKGPVVQLRAPGAEALPHDPNAPQGADGRWILPVVSDGDAADLVLRATGSPPAEFGGPTSAAYRAALAAEEP
ncbi:MAG: hypothetical protein JNK02_10960 [Planctomycetes bacterium]|nr:hypothetical protein [Planctomycetota bacterium]